MRTSRKLNPERERQRHRIFDLLVLPVLTLVTLFLIWKAMAG